MAKELTFNELAVFSEVWIKELAFLCIRLKVWFWDRMQECADFLPVT